MQISDVLTFPGQGWRAAGQFGTSLGHLRLDLGDYMDQAARLKAHPVYTGTGSKATSKTPVLIVPPLLGWPQLMEPLRRTVENNGYPAFHWSGGVNWWTPHQAATIMARDVREIVRTTGMRVVILGASAGGGVSVAVQKRFPERVIGTFSLGSPRKLPFEIEPTLLRVYRAILSAQGSRCASEMCGLSESCPVVKTGLRALTEIGRTAAGYTKRDRALGWQNTMTDEGDNFEFSASHIGLAACLEAAVTFLDWLEWLAQPSELGSQLAFQKCVAN